MHLRIFIIGLSVLLAGGLFTWLFLARSIFIYIDRFFLTIISNLPITPLEIRPTDFAIGSHIWPFPRLKSPQFQIQLDSQNRLTLITTGVSFCFGPIVKLQKADHTSDALNFTFEPDPTDVVSFTQSHSRLSWPTPFEFNIMGASVSRWRRNLYDRLLWKKSSGQTLEIIWRHEEWFFKKTGWSDTYHLRLHALHVSRNPGE
jgi:hypothetical protein